jgi:DNA-binding transcriptional LysR family regulator
MDWTDRIGRRLRPRDLHVFLSVVEHGSMAKAAERLACSRPVISRAIADLEAILGVRLLDRSTHGIEPTSYGLALLQRSKAVFDELRQSVQEIAYLHDPNNGELRLACVEPMMAGIAATAIDQLLATYPGLHVDTLTGNAFTVQELLRNRNCEVVLTRQVGNERELGIDEEILFHEKLFVVTHVSSPWARRPRTSLRDLADAPWILAKHEIEEGGPMFEAFRKLGLPPPDVRVRSDSLALRYGLLATGRFLTLIPSSVFLLGPPQPSLKVLSIELAPWQRPRIIAMLKGRALSPPAALFVERVRKLVQPLAGKLAAAPARSRTTRRRASAK